MSPANDIDCQEVRRHLAELADGAQDADIPCEAMRAHAEGCEDCARAMKEELHVRTVLKRCCQANAPTSLRAAIVTSISRTTTTTTTVVGDGPSRA